MKRILYTLIALCAVGLFSCRKSSDNLTIKQYDDDQIKQYIKNNGLTGMKPDDSPGGDTTGIYYQVITPNTTGTVIKYTDLVPYVFTAKTFDGKYSSTDTILNHVYTYGGYISKSGTQNGVQLAIVNIAKTYGTKIRVLIPSRLMYGINGTTLSSYNTAGTVTYNTVAGNQCLDYTITVIDPAKQAAYDDLSITKYLSANGLTNQYTKTASGLWYRVTQAGDPAGATINNDSIIGTQYTGTLFNGIIFDQQNTTDGTAAYPFEGLYNTYPGVKEAFLLNLPTKVTTGAKLSLIMPSRLGAGQSAVSSPTGGFTLPAFSCLRFEFNIVTVTN